MVSASRNEDDSWARFVERSARGERVELIDAELVQKVSPSPEHGVAQAGLGEVLAPFRRRGGGGSGPGGWWLMTEVEVAYDAANVFRHDAVGFRKDAHPERPLGTPVRVRPDWAAEVLSPSTARYDLVEKLRTLEKAGVPYYWVIDPEHEILTVHRLGGEGYVNALTAGIGDIVRAAPFDAIDISIAALFGHDEPG